MNNYFHFWRSLGTGAPLFGTSNACEVPAGGSNALGFCNCGCCKCVGFLCSSAATLHRFLSSVTPIQGFWSLHQAALLRRSTKNHYLMPCPPQAYCPEGSAAPMPCPKTFYCPGQTAEPIACPAKHYCLAKASVPLPCPEGFFCPGGFVEPFSCPAGSRVNSVSKKKFFVLQATSRPYKN